MKKNIITKPTVKNIVGEIVPLTVEQVQKFFPEPWKGAVHGYKENVKYLKQEGDWNPKDPGILHPKDCLWSLQKCDPNSCFTAYLTSLEKEGYVGYELHMYDGEAIASYSGGGSDMSWTGEEWEM